MIARVVRFSITLDPHHHFRVHANPLGLCRQGRSRGWTEDGTVEAEIDGVRARLGKEIRPCGVDSLEDRLRSRGPFAQSRELGRRAGRNECEHQERGKPAHQSITPDQSGSEPFWGMTMLRASLPSRETRNRRELPEASLL